MIGRSNWRTNASTAALAIGLTLTAVAAPAAAQTQIAQQNQTATFDIPAGSLANSLRRYAEVTGLQTVYSSDLVEGVQSSAVQGRYTAAEALSVMLAGTGLSARQSGSTIALEPNISAGISDDGSRVLGPVRVEGSTSTFSYSGGPSRGDGIAQLGGVRGGQDDEATGYRPNVATVGGLSPVAIEDIPRSISVLTQAQIDKQDITDIGDALRRLPGVAILERPDNNLSTGAAIQSRGFDLSRVQLDGGASRPLNVISNGMLDLGPYERVELVRGPNAIATGGGSPGGSLNLVRKRPGSVEHSEISAVLGSFDRKALQVDYSTPSLVGSSFAFRGVASISDQGYFYEGGASQNGLLYGIVDAPLGEKARLEVGGQYSVIHQDGSYSGLYRYTGGEIIDLGNYYLNLSPDWATDDTENTGVFSRLYVDISDAIDLQVGFDLESGRQARTRLAQGLNIVEGSGLSVGSYASANRSSLDTSNISFDFKLTGNSRFWGLEHSWAVAGELTESSVVPQVDSYDTTGFPSFANLDQFLAGLSTYKPAFGPQNRNPVFGGATTRAGLVISDVISWRDLIELTLSARRYFSDRSTFSVAQSEGNVFSLDFSQQAQGSGRAEAQWAPSWSLAIKPSRNLTIYGTRAEGREELTVPRYGIDGAPFPLMTFENLEGGVKFATDRWIATLSYYDLVQDNVLRVIGGSSCLPTNTRRTPCYVLNDGVQKSVGADFEFSGEIIPGLSVVANYTWADITYTATGDDLLTEAPRNAGQVFVDWSPGFTPKTSFRAGVRYRGEISQAGYRTIYDPNTGDYLDAFEFDFVEPSYTVFDLGVRHQITDGLSLDVFAENITDEQYLSTISAYEQNFPGSPRSIVATLRWTPADQTHARSTTGMAPFGDPADWYAAVETGIWTGGDLDASGDGLSQDGVTPVNWTFETGYKAIGLARLGYRLSPRLRTELEGSFRNAVFGDIGGGSAAPFGVCGARFADLSQGFDCDKADGDMASWTLLLNGLYDFGPEDGRLRPFVGIGLGVSHNSIDFAGKMEGIGLDTPWNQNPRRRVEEGIGGDTGRVAFTYQLLAGLSYRLSGQATIDATYRYYAVPALSWGSYNLEGIGGFPQYGDPWPALTGRVGDFETDFQAHTLTVGLRWAFGSR